jgi:hypothetical protein
MSDDEVDELLKAVDTSSGEINYTGALDNDVWFDEGEDTDGCIKTSSGRFWRTEF